MIVSYGKERPDYIKSKYDNWTWIFLAETMADLVSLNAYLKDTEMIIKNGKVQPKTQNFY